MMCYPVSVVQPHVRLYTLKLGLYVPLENHYSSSTDNTLSGPAAGNCGVGEIDKLWNLPFIIDVAQINGESFL